MPKIVLKNITKKFGSKSAAVENLNLVIEDRSFITLLGPSGCGKTTTLRMIAGLETPTSGEITINDEVVFSSEKGIDVPPEKRGVGFLFQNYALWPHMTVYENITFGLENLKWEKEKIKARAAELMDMLKIGEYAGRYPSELSGGQQQRVAIARTLATGPKTLFMDEPLSNLDAKLRMEMRTELKRLHLETDSTFVYVTHDQLEAMTLSTKICLLKQGQLQQYAAPLTVYHEPANSFVADFIGSPNINLLPVVVEKAEKEKSLLKLGDTQLHFAYAGETSEIASGSQLILGVRPENVLLSETEGDFTAKVYSTLPSGMETVVRLEMNGIMLTAVVFGGVDFAVNQPVKIGFKGDQHHLFYMGDAGNKLASGSLRK